jgi:predicted transposase/invertase (TIGR01784 family)
MASKIIFSEDDDIIEICKDNVFKAVFTKDMPQSKIALSKLVSALIGREVIIENILANEIPINSLHDRQVRFDINCKAENGELVNVEMCYNPDPFEPVRMEFHTGRLFTAQNIKGVKKDYSDLLRVYQIAILGNDSIIPDEMFFHTFEYFDPLNGISLNGRTRIITLELSKLENVVEKPIDEMTPYEFWAIFFRYLTDKNKRNIINEIVKREEGIAMASEVVMSISKDLEERLRLMSIEKAELDYQSKIVHAERKGQSKERKGVAQKMVNAGEPLNKIAEYTGLSPEEIEKL